MSILDTKTRKMKIKPKNNDRAEAWEKYCATCREAKKVYKNTVRVAWELYRSVSKVSSAAKSELPDNQ